MARRFRQEPKGSRHRRVYGQRARAGSAFSRRERRLGATAAAVTWADQKTEILLEALAHDVMLLARGFRPSPSRGDGRGTRGGGEGLK